MRKYAALPINIIVAAVGTPILAVLLSNLIPCQEQSNSFTSCKLGLGIYLLPITLLITAYVEYLVYRNFKFSNPRKLVIATYAALVPLFLIGLWSSGNIAELSPLFHEYFFFTYFGGFVTAHVLGILILKITNKEQKQKS